MKHKNNMKLALDIIMFIIFVLVLTFSNEPFHEIAGLGVGFAFVIHILLNIQWLKKVSLKIFDSQLPGKTRFGYWLNVLLLISLFLTIASGILISKVLFPGISIHHGLKGIHSIMANFSLVLVSIHIGLHWEGLVSRTIQIFKAKPSDIFRNIAIFIIFLLLLFGGYKLVSHQIIMTTPPNSASISSQQQDINPNDNVINNSDKRLKQNNGSKQHQYSNPIGVILYPTIIIAIAFVTRSLFLKRR